MQIMEWYTDPPEPDIEADLKYRENQRKTGRFKMCQKLANEYTKIGCRSILDVGCKSVGFLEDLLGYTEKMQIDYCVPHIVNDIEFRQIDLAETLYSCRDTCLTTYDVVVCCEVMEHVHPKNKRVFAKRLLELANKRLLVSIPFNWKGSDELHPHDGINRSNLIEWFYPFVWDKECVVGGRHLIVEFNTENKDELCSMYDH